MRDVRRVMAAALTASLVLVVARFEATAQRLPVEISNRTPLDTGAFSLTIEIDGGAILLTGNSFRRRPRATVSLAMFSSVCCFSTKAGAVLAESTTTIFQRDLGYGYSGVIRRVAPEPGGVDVSALASVVLTVRKLTTQETLDREREKQQQAARAAAEARLRAEREAEAKQAHLRCDGQP